MPKSRKRGAANHHTENCKWGPTKNFNNEIYIKDKQQQHQYGKRVSKAAKDQLEKLSGYGIPPL